VPRDQAPDPIRLPDRAWADPAVLDLCREHDANGLFRLAKKYGASNDRIAYWTGTDAAEISKRVNNKLGRVATLDRWQRIADALNMPDHARLAVGLAPVHPASGLHSLGLDSGGAASRPVLPDPVAGPGRSDAAGSAGGGVIDPGFPVSLLVLLAHYGRTDNMLGPRSLLAAVAAQLTLIEQLWRVAQRSVRPDLLAVGACYAEFAGWLHQDAGDSVAGERWSLRALELAHAAQSDLLVSYVLMRQSNHASGAGDGPRALGLANAALTAAPPGYGRLRALALRQRAHGYALAGDAAECERALDAARHEASLPPTRPDAAIQPFTEYCTPAYVEMEAADCWMMLGQPARAVTIFEAGLSAWPATYRRDRGVHLARLASAHAACGELDAAQAVAVEAATVTSETVSARAMRELRSVVAQLSDAGHPLELDGLHDALRDGLAGQLER
jgi:hypothetical protein